MKRILVAGLLSVLCACASTTEEGEVGVKRRQLLLVPNEQIIESSYSGYQQTKDQAKAQNKLDVNAAQLDRVQKISKRLIPYTTVFRKDASTWSWEVHVIASDEVNAYCMPGGKIMFYSGIIDKLNLTDGEIAAVMGHEIAHALREHGRERMSEEMIKSGILGLAVATGKLDEKYADVASMVTNVAVSLPHSRGQETEADEVGMELMARAGYNPFEAVALWRKMGNQGGGKPPELLSTHPSDQSRQKNLASLAPRMTPLYQAATSRF